MPNTFTITLTAQDFVAANWLMVKRHWVRRWAPWFVLVVGLAFGTLLAGTAWHLHPDMTRGALAKMFLRGMLCAVVFLGVQLFFMMRAIRRSSARAFDQLEESERSYSCNFDDAALNVTVDGQTTIYLWAQFSRMIEDHRFLLLFRTEATFVAVPKWQVPAAVLQALRQSVSRRIAP
ncbi:MAG: YcxB family protein [Novosphingobium sp.]